MKPTHDSLLLRVSCLRTHQTVFNLIRLNTVWWVRKHETRSNSQSCVGFISLTFLYIYIIIFNWLIWEQKSTPLRKQVKMWKCDFKHIYLLLRVSCFSWSNHQPTSRNKAFNLRLRYTNLKLKNNFASATYQKAIRCMKRITKGRVVTEITY